MAYAATYKQLRCLELINKSIETDGVAPSYDELAAWMGLKSKSGIHRMIVALEDRGHIRRLPYKNRAIEVLNIPAGLLPVADAPPTIEASFDVPFIGKLNVDTDTFTKCSDYMTRPCP